MRAWLWLATFLAGLLGGMLGLLLILPLGLVMIEWIVFPLAQAVGALLAGLAAGWVGTWLARDGTRTRLEAVVAATEVAGLVLALVVLGWPAFRQAILGPVIGIAMVSALTLAIVASTATVAYRRPRAEAGRDRALTLALLALALVGVPVVVVLAGRAGLTGA